MTVQSSRAGPSTTIHISTHTDGYIHSLSIALVRFGACPVHCIMRWGLLFLTGCVVRALLCAQASTVVGDGSAPVPLFTARQFTTRDGLPHRIVNSIAQDERGFIWLGTPQGLARFDGRDVMTLTSANGLSSDAVRTVVRDRQGKLWVHHTNGGMEIVDPVSLHVSPHPALLGGLPVEANGTVTSLVATADRTIVFAQNGHLFWYRDPGSGLHAYRVPCDGRVDLLRSAPGEQVWCSCHVRPGTEFPVRLARYDLGLVTGAAAPRVTARSPDTVAIACVRGQDELLSRPKEEAGSYVLVLSNGSLRNWWVPANGDFDPASAMSARDMSAKDGNDVFRMQLTEDLWLVNMSIRRMHAGDDPSAAPVVFDLASIYPDAHLGELAVLRDRTGHVWVGGEFGLIQVDMRPDRFQRFLWNGSTRQVGENRIRGMVVLGNELHVNTETTGYWVLDARSGAVLDHREKDTFRAGMIGDGADGLWRSRQGSMLHERRNGEVDRTIKALGGNYDAWTAVLLANGTLLVGSIKGLRSVAPQRSGFDLIASGSADLDQAWVAHLMTSDTDRVLACTNAGLFELDTAGKVLERWWTGAPEHDPHRFPTDDIRYAYMDSTGLYWLATGSQGLLRWDRAHGRIRSIDRKQGLPTTSIHAIYPDNHGMLWMPSDNGIVRYAPRTGQVKVFTTADGTGFDEFNRLSHAQGPDGRLYFGGLNGITAFHPDDLTGPVEETTGPLVLKSIKVQREEGDVMQDLTVDVLGGGPVLMRPKDRFLAVDIALLSYDDPAQLEYAWRIDGIDVDWNMQSEPFLRITALPYGDHLLRIKARDAEGRWTDELRIPIAHASPLYLRWWAIGGMVLLVAFIVWSVVRYRERQLHHVIRMRDRIATDLHDEVGSNLSSIVLFSTVVAKHTDALPEYAAGMLQRIKDNSKRAMESMNDIVWSVNSGHDSMEDLLDRLRAYAEPLCEAAGITVEFQVEAGATARRLAMEQRKDLYLICKEAVSNAVRHSRCKRITVALRPVGRSIELVVADDGTGLPEETARGSSLGGNGLGNMARRAKEIGGELRVLAGEPQGTRVVLLFTPAQD